MGGNLHTVCSRGGLLRREGRQPTLNVLPERKQVQAREKYHHEEHEGHKVKLNCETLRDLRVLRGKRILSHVT